MDLCVTVNNKLLWNEQCDKLMCKGNSQLGMLMRTCLFTIKKELYILQSRDQFLNIAPLYRDVKVPTRLLLLMQHRTIVIKWINGRRFDYYSDLEYFNNKKSSIFYQ